MTYVNAPFMKKVLNITERKRKSNIHHYCKSDDFRASFEVAEWGVFCHSKTLQISPARFKQVYSDSAARTAQYKGIVTSMEFLLEFKVTIRYGDQNPLMVGRLFIVGKSRCVDLVKGLLTDQSQFLYLRLP